MNIEFTRKNLEMNSINIKNEEFILCDTYFLAMNSKQK